MTTEQYDQLLADLKEAWTVLHSRRAAVQDAERVVDSLLRRLHREDSRLVREALASTHSASRKLVVGE